MALSTDQYGYLIDPLVPITDATGRTIKDGFLRVYIAGSSTPVITYRNYDGAANEQTIELDNSGRCKYPVIVSKSLAYKVVVYDAEHSQETPIITVDKMFAIGASVTVGAGATVITGIDGLTTKPDGFVDASVIGTDGYVALSHTLVEDDLNTDAKVTAVEEDRYIPLLNEDVNDPDSKITLGRMWRWVLGKIKSLSTTITAFRSGDVIPVDGPSGTAKMSKDDLLKETAELPLAKVNAVNENLLDLSELIEYKGTYGCPDYSALANSTNSSVVFFQKSSTQKKPSIVTKIKYSAWSTRTAEIYKVKVTGSTATETLLFSVGKGETGYEEYAVNIPLAEDEYIGIKGFFFYKPSYTDESYATITGGTVSAFTSGILGLSYEGIIDGELPNKVENLKTNFDGFSKIISDVNGKIYKSGGDISKSTNYTTQTAVFWATSPVSKVKYVTSIKIPDLGYGCSIYKVIITGTTATSVKLADIPAHTEHYNVFVELADNEYIGISGYFKYSNSAGTGYNYYYADANNKVHQTSGGTLSLEIEGFAEEKDPYNVVVAADGSGDYTTIHDALVGTYGIDTASKPVTIKVKAGIFDEPSMDGAFSPYCHYRHLAIIGENKENTIVKNTNGYYYPNVQDNSCIKVSGNIYIANLTLISLMTDYQDPPDTEHTNQKNAYCVHIDSGASSGDITEVNNCIMYNDHNCCVGIGIKTKQTVKIKNCEMRSNFVNPNESFGGAVIYAHDDSYGTAGQMDEFLDIVGCIIRSENSELGIKVKNVYGCDIVCTFVGNALSFLDAGSGCSLGATTYKDKVCSGNNVANMNY